MRRYRYRKIYSWDPGLAYLVGLITADGCLINNNRHINLTSNDLEILEFAIKYLDLKVKIQSKKNGFGGYGNFIQFGDVALYDFLLNIGLTPAKSKTISKISIPFELYGDFLRGVFDGDGTIYGFWDRRWRSSFMFYIEFTSGSRSFLEWLHEENTKSIGVKGGKIKPGIRALKLSYAKTDSKKILRHMYYENNLPALSRKKQKLARFLATDPNADKFVGRVAESVDALD